LASKAGVLTPSPSPSTRPAATIHGGAGLRIDAIMGDEDHFASLILTERFITLLLST
jgi:hypothetical protein